MKIFGTCNHLFPYEERLHDDSLGWTDYTTL